MLQEDWVKNKIMTIRRLQTFSSVVRLTTVWLSVAVAAQFCLKLHQMEVRMRFFMASFRKEVYIAQPHCCRDTDHPHCVCKLVHSHYGLEQAPRTRNERFTSFLPSLKPWLLILLYTLKLLVDKNILVFICGWLGMMKQIFNFWNCSAEETWNEIFGFAKLLSRSAERVFWSRNFRLSEGICSGKSWNIRHAYK